MPVIYMLQRYWPLARRYHLLDLYIFPPWKGKLFLTPCLSSFYAISWSVWHPIDNRPPFGCFNTQIIEDIYVTHNINLSIYFVRDRALLSVAFCSAACNIYIDSRLIFDPTTFGVFFSDWLEVELDLFVSSSSLASSLTGQRQVYIIYSNWWVM